MQGWRKRVRKCFPFLTQAFLSVPSLCGIGAALLFSPARSLWPPLRSQVCKMAPWDPAFGGIIYFFSSYSFPLCSFSLWPSSVQKFMIFCQLFCLCSMQLWKHKQGDSCLKPKHFVIFCTHDKGCVGDLDTK